MEAVDDQAAVGPVDALDDVPRLLPAVDDRAPGDGLVADPDRRRVGGGEIGERANVRGDEVEIGRDARALEVARDEDEVGADERRQVEPQLELLAPSHRLRAIEQALRVQEWLRRQRRETNGDGPAAPARQARANGRARQSRQRLCVAGPPRSSRHTASHGRRGIRRRSAYQPRHSERKRTSTASMPASAKAPSLSGSACPADARPSAMVGRPDCSILGAGFCARDAGDGWAREVETSA